MDEEQINRAAEAAHEANRVYCESHGDRSQPRWGDAPGWQRASAIAGVRAILASPWLSPEESHANWMRTKAADGWEYGPVKDVEEKAHPCMVPYGELPMVFATPASSSTTTTICLSS